MAIKQDESKIRDIIAGIEENLDSDRAKKEPAYRRAMEEELRRQEANLRNMQS